jgi:hypothetical protein
MANWYYLASSILLKSLSFWQGNFNKIFIPKQKGGLLYKRWEVAGEKITCWQIYS